MCVIIPWFFSRRLFYNDYFFRHSLAHPLTHVYQRALEGEVGLLRTKAAIWEMEVCIQSILKYEIINLLYPKGACISFSLGPKPSRVWQHSLLRGIELKDL